MIELEVPNFIAGSEKRFAQFISNLDENKIAHLTHTDLDGISAAKIVNETINPDVRKFIEYSELNSELLKDLKKQKVKKLIITDLSITEPEFIEEAEKNFEILIIDHHQFAKDYNSNKTFFINAQDFCATYLCYYLFSKVKDLEKFDWLVVCASLSDFMLKNKEWIREVYKKYNNDEEIDPNNEVGEFAKLKNKLDFALIYCKSRTSLEEAFNEIGGSLGKIGKLEEYSKIVEESIISALKKFEKEKQEINGRILWIFEPQFALGSKISNILSKQNPKKTFITIRFWEEKCFISVRRQDKKENAAEFLQKLLHGLENSNAGGHIPAAGGHFLKKDLQIIMERLKKF